MNGLIITIIISVLTAISLVLYCCIHIQTPYDRETNDDEQQKYLESLRPPKAEPRPDLRQTAKDREKGF